MEDGIPLSAHLHQVNKEQRSFAGPIFGQRKATGSATDEPGLSSIATAAFVASPVPVSVPVASTGINLPHSIANVHEKMVQSNTSESIINKNIVSNKKLTNVCIVRPQQQPLLSSPSTMSPMAPSLTTGSTTELIEACQFDYCRTATDDNRLQTQTGSANSLLEKSILPPPYTPTSNLWQTPLLLEMGVPSSFLIAKTGLMTPHRQHSSSSAPTAELPYVCSALPNSYNSIFSTYNHGNQELCPDNQWNQGLYNGSSLSLTTAMVASTTITTTTAMAKVAPIVVHSQASMQYTSANKPALSSPFKNSEECIQQPLYENGIVNKDDDCLKTASKLLKKMMSIENDHSNKTLPLYAFDLPQKHSIEEKLSVVVSNYGAGGVHRAVTTIPPTAVVPPARAILGEQHKTEFINSNGKTLHSSALELLEDKIGIKSVLCDDDEKEYLTQPALMKLSAEKDDNYHSLMVADNNEKQNSNGSDDKWSTDEINSSDNKRNNSIQLLEEESLYNSCKNSHGKYNEEVFSNTSESSKFTSNSSTIGQKRKLSEKRNSSSQNVDEYDWYMSTAKKGAVAVVQVDLSDSSIELFDHERQIENLSRADILPYCIPTHWLFEHGHLKLGANVIEHRRSLSDEESCSNALNHENSKETKSLFSLERSLAREERIATYKQQLRRQAMQYKGTHSLQKLSLQMCKKRLITVDRVSRKHRQEYKNRK